MEKDVIFDYQEFVVSYVIKMPSMTVKALALDLNRDSSKNFKVNGMKVTHIGSNFKCTSAVLRDRLNADFDPSTGADIGKLARFNLKVKQCYYVCLFLVLFPHFYTTSR